MPFIKFCGVPGTNSRDTIRHQQLKREKNNSPNQELSKKHEGIKNKRAVASATNQPG